MEVLSLHKCTGYCREAICNKVDQSAWMQTYLQLVVVFTIESKHMYWYGGQTSLGRDMQRYM